MNVHDHPAFSAEAIQKAPIALRRQAMAAFEPDAAPFLVHQTLKHAVKLSAPAILGLLPICIRHLGVLNSADPNPEALRRADSALNALANMVQKLPPALAQLCWPVAFGAYCVMVEDDAVAYELAVGESHARLILLVSSFVQQLCLHPEGRNTVKSTLGYRPHLMRMWAFVSRPSTRARRAIRPPPSELDLCLSVLGFATNPHIVGGDDSGNYSQLIDGAGGSVAHLASLFLDILRFLRRRASAPELSIDIRNDIPTIFASILQTILDMDSNTSQQDPISARFADLYDGGEVVQELVLLGAIPTLLECGKWVVSGFPSQTPRKRSISIDALDSLLWVLAGLASTHLGHHRRPVQILVEHGLLPLLLDCQLQLEEMPDHIRYNSTIRDIILTFVADILPRELIRAPYLLAVRTAVQTSASRLQPFSGLRQSRSWQLVQEHLNVLDEAKPVERLQACDGPTCEEVLIHSLLKKCSGCRCLFYCSRKCQIADWRNGHRDVCLSYSSGTLTLTSPRRLSPARSERSFIRTLLDHDYQKNWVTIQCEHVMYLLHNLQQTHRKVAGHLGDYRKAWDLCLNQPFITGFDYLQQPMSLWYLPCKLVPNQAVHTAEWQDILARARAAARSDSRPTYHIHVVQLFSEGTPSFIVVPLRCKGLDLHRKLKTIAAMFFRTPLGRKSNISERERDGLEADIRKEIEALRVICRETGLVEFH
ncbi:hypothetical protein HMN09_00466200 [Mycena chlorophos]|uniref:MYND-type domain-containing protein n=1 Tax=Mycena chlorophos TaxID=658473 RepID=A0A8H6TIH6_MYCCL|nr:hypothetical protein HMN09_00466200 [Mycena chlorophos]